MQINKTTPRTLKSTEKACCGVDACPIGGRLWAVRHGIQPRYGSGRSFRLLSYAVFVRGVCQVSHGTTAALRRDGVEIGRLMRLEQERSGLPIIHGFNP